MANELIRPAMRVQIELALAGQKENIAALDRLVGEARRIPLTGAEIDAATQGRSFDAVTASAVAFALALRRGDPVEIAGARKKLLVFGIAAVASDICEIVRRSESLGIV